jgi:hypothetical protein
VANDANIVTSGLYSVFKGNVDEPQVALTVVIYGRDNRRRTAECTPVRGGPLCRQTPSILPVISLSPNFLAKIKRCFCVSSRMNVGTFWNPPHEPPKIFKGSCSQTITNSRPLHHLWCKHHEELPRPISPEIVDNFHAVANKRRI